MKKQNNATAQIIKALDKLGYYVDKVEFQIAGNPEINPYMEVSIKISRQGYPPCPHIDNQSE